MMAAERPDVRSCHAGDAIVLCGTAGVFNVFACTTGDAIVLCGAARFVDVLPRDTADAVFQRIHVTLKRPAVSCQSSRIEWTEQTCEGLMADRGSFTAAEAVAKYLPPGQSVHEGLPDASAYIPAAQMVQSASWLLPESWPYLPATQSMQSASAFTSL